MIKKAVAFLCFLSLLLPSLSSCMGGKEITYYHYFNTVITLSSDRMGRKEFDAHVAAAEKEISEYHNLFDIYYEYSGIANLCSLNKAAGKGAPLKIDRKLFDFLSEGVELYQMTNGQMNIMMGAVTSLWNQARTEAESGVATLPSDAALAEAKKHVAIESLVLNEEDLTAYITDPKASVDVGAFGKGYAAERVARFLMERGVKDDFLLDFGGNLRLIGGRGNGEPFALGIMDPAQDRLQENALDLSARDMALVTSGSYFRYFEVAGKRYHHLIDPETARPADTFVSVSILGKDSGFCDALSTALFVMDRAEGEALIRSLDGYEAVWITPSGEIFYTDGIKDFIVEE